MLAGDNAIVIGALAAVLPPEQRKRVILMGVAANIIAKYIERYRWIGWVGLVVIVYVAGKMIWEGWHEVHPVLMLAAGM